MNREDCLDNERLSSRGVEILKKRQSGMNQQHILQQLESLYVAISKGDYAFPEFTALRSKKARKEYSLKAHSVVLRLVKQWGLDADTETNTD